MCSHAYVGQTDRDTDFFRVNECCHIIGLFTDFGRSIFCFVFFLFVVASDRRLRLRYSLSFPVSLKYETTREELYLFSKAMSSGYGEKKGGDCFGGKLNTVVNKII